MRARWEVERKPPPLPPPPIIELAGGGRGVKIIEAGPCNGVRGGLVSLAEKNRCLGVVSLLLLFRAGAESLDVDVTLVAKIPQDMMAMPTSFARELKN